MRQRGMGASGSGGARETGVADHLGGRKSRGINWAPVHYWDTDRRSASRSRPSRRYRRIRPTKSRSWDDVHLLSIRIDRLKQWWRPGLICIGDAAHAMSPIGGFGVNLETDEIPLCGRPGTMRLGSERGYLRVLAAGFSLASRGPHLAPLEGMSET